MDMSLFSFLYGWALIVLTIIGVLIMAAVLLGIGTWLEQQGPILRLKFWAYVATKPRLEKAVPLLLSGLGIGVLFVLPASFFWLLFVATFPNEQLAEGTANSGEITLASILVLMSIVALCVIGVVNPKPEAKELAEKDMQSSQLVRGI